MSCSYKLGCQGFRHINYCCKILETLDRRVRRVCNMQVKLPGKNVESYSIISPVSLSGSTLKYGEFSAKEPFSVEEMRLHFENNSPFAVVTKLVREVEISNWGNVYYEEHYTIKHKGPKIRV